MNYTKGRVTKVLSEINSEKEGITAYELGRKLNDKYPDYLSFANFEEFIKINIITGRLEQKNEKLFITERGKRAIEV
ncbi:MAG: hypothetical protein ACOYVD_14445 [Bacillota bacterium]